MRPSDWGTLMRMARCIRVIAALALFGAPVSRLTAQSVAEPMAVAQRYLNAVRTSDWETVLQLTDANSIWEWATLQRANLRPQKRSEREPETVETMMRRDSTLPRAVAEYFMSQRTMFADRPDLDLAIQFADVRRLSQLDSLSDGELFTRSLRAKRYEYMWATAMERMGCTEAPPPPETGADKVLGVALLHDGKAMALYVPWTLTSVQVSDDADMDFAIEYLRLVQTRGGWRVLAGRNARNGGGFAIGFDGSPCQKK
jgi:hypothetical protein